MAGESTSRTGSAPTDKVQRRAHNHGGDDGSGRGFLKHSLEYEHEIAGSLGVTDSEFHMQAAAELLGGEFAAVDPVAAKLSLQAVFRGPDFIGSPTRLRVAPLSSDPILFGLDVGKVH